MGITLAENRLDLLGDRLFVEDRGVRVGRLTWGPRIGINVGTDRLWRVYVAGHGGRVRWWKRSTTQDTEDQATSSAVSVLVPLSVHLVI